MNGLKRVTIKKSLIVQTHTDAQAVVVFFATTARAATVAKNATVGQGLA